MGTSAYFGELRGRGAAITNNGKSSGSVSFMQLFDTTMNVISQGATRRGAFAAYLDIDHPDAEELLQIRDVGHPIQNLFFAVCVPDYWMQEMIDGDSRKRELWAKVLESRQQKGLPYIFFTDNVNRNKPEIYKHLDMKINASNLCVSGDTIIQIRLNSGCQQVTVLEAIEMFEQGADIEVLSYADSSLVEYKKILKTYRQGIKHTKTYKLIPSDIKNSVAYVQCTPDHKFLNADGVYREIQNSRNLASALIDDATYEVVEVDDSDANVEVFDITVADNHNFVIFNSIIENDETEDIITCDIVAHNCSEIALPSSDDESFVCCLSSMNLALYDEWKDTDAVKYATYFLDAVMSEFIAKTSRKNKGYKHLQSAHDFAERHRAIGLGVMGWHSLLQSKMIPFESFEAKLLNTEIFKKLQAETNEASIELGELYGYAPIFDEVEDDVAKSKGIVKRRNTTTIAIAPTTSSSSILGQVSAGIEPFSSNYYKAGLAKGNFIRKNRYLQQLLIERGQDNEETWRTIMMAQGSVQHLDFLTDEEKEVFKTFKEISQKEIIIQAASRQKFIDQAQSLNINIPSELPIKEVNALIIEAWKLGVKTLYYQRSQSIAKEFLTNLVSCKSCES